MYKNLRIIIVIPSYKVSKHIAKVLSSIPEFVDHIIVVDDGCPENSGEKVKKINNSKVTVVKHEKNQGVGASVISGYRMALTLNGDIVVKMDGDGQMDPAYLENLILPLVAGEADYTKGNRFYNFSRLANMPKIRIFGNSLLSFLIKAVSGYWNISDPTNGYVAITRETLSELNLDKIAKDYFFESDMLVSLNIINAVVKDVNIPALYGDEESSLNIFKVICKFPWAMIQRFCNRIFLKYYIYDFNMASVYMLVGVPIFIFGIVFGTVEWIDSLLTNRLKTAGTIMLAALPLILSFQMLLMAIQIDINNIPRK